jgi:hypothetical protein
MKEEKIKFSQLSAPLKFAIIMAWILGIVYSALFVIGMFIGIIEALW